MDWDVFFYGGNCCPIEECRILCLTSGVGWLLLAVPIIFFIAFLSYLLLPDIGRNR